MKKLLCLIILALFTASVVAQDDKNFSVAGLEFRVPESWTAQTPTSSMRAGQWVSGSEQKSADRPEIVVFFFGAGQGGDAQSNIARWQGTMSGVQDKPAQSQVQTRTQNGYKITQVTCYGTYAGSMTATGVPPLSKPRYGLCGVVVESPGGNIFIRMTGTDRLVRAALPQLQEFVNSVHPVN